MSRQVAFVPPTSVGMTQGQRQDIASAPNPKAETGEAAVPIFAGKSGASYKSRSPGSAIETQYQVS